MGSPNLTEIVTTTQRNRKMKQGPKAALKQAQSGTPVSEKNYSPKKKMDAAAGSSTQAPSKYEGSSDDSMRDYSEAKRRGMAVSDYEDSARDRIADVAGERRMAAKETSEDGEASSSGHKRGTPAFANPPKTSHGFGHPTSARDGHLRNSGHSGAHQIGKKR